MTGFIPIVTTSYNLYLNFIPFKHDLGKVTPRVHGFPEVIFVKVDFL